MARSTLPERIQAHVFRRVHEGMGNAAFFFIRIDAESGPKLLKSFFQAELIKSDREARTLAKERNRGVEVAAFGVTREGLAAFGPEYEYVPLELKAGGDDPEHEFSDPFEDGMRNRKKLLKDTYADPNWEDGSFNALIWLAAPGKP